jgi:hypothetical protein
MLGELADVYRARIIVLALGVSAAFRDLTASLIALCRRGAATVLHAAVAVLSARTDAVAAERLLLLWLGRLLFRRLLCDWRFALGSRSHCKRRLLNRLNDTLLYLLQRLLLAAEEQQKGQREQYNKRFSRHKITCERCAEKDSRLEEPQLAVTRVLV